MNRYEFEIMTFIDKSGINEYSMRMLSDSIRISETKIKECLDTLIDDELIIKDDTLLEITEKGYEALEPYRVKKAIIIAAGFGSRMMPATADRPKPLVTVNGVRILDTLLDALVSNGIQDITVVRGYKKNRFDDLLAKYPFLKFVDNEEYDRTNNISSVITILDKIDACYLCEADLYIANPEIISKYQYTSNILGSWSLETDDWSFQLDSDGHIINYQKGNRNCWNYYGISFWTKSDSEKLKEDFRQVYENVDGGKDYFWEFVPLVLKREKYGVEIRQCNKSDIIEIDSFYELTQLDPSYRIS